MRNAVLKIQRGVGIFSNLIDNTYNEEEILQVTDLLISP